MTTPLLVIGNKNYSSWSLRAWIALRKADVVFEECKLPLDTPEFTRRIGDYSPTRRVPVLRDGEVCVWDSLAIGEYINERWAAGKLLPEAPATRARARSLCAEMHSGFAALRAEMPMNCRAEGRRVPVGQGLAADIERVQEVWAGERGRNATAGPWLMGSFSLVDAMYIPVALRFRTYGVNVTEPVQAYMDTVWNDPDISAWVQAGRDESDVVEADEAGT